MQVQRGEQSQLRFLHAGIELRLCPVQISLDFGLQVFEDRKELFVNAAYGIESDLAGDKGMLGIHGAVKGLFGPSEDDLEDVAGGSVGSVVKGVVGTIVIAAPFVFAVKDHFDLRW